MEEKNLALSISPEKRAYYEKFIREHPIPEDYDPNILDDNRFSEAENIAMSYLMKRFLEMVDQTNQIESIIEE